MQAQPRVPREREGAETSEAPARGDAAAVSEAPANVCGVDRWPVKVLADSSADRVRLDSPQIGTIEELRAISTVFYVSTKSRSPAEEQVFTVEGWLAGYKFEPGDSDLHVVIKDDSGKNMIVEFPHPDCMEGSRVLKQAAEARSKFRAMLRTLPTTRFIWLRKLVRVRVTGVLFFDKVHNQIGVAPNGVELHPVFGIEKVQ
jgi:hypothetical protein